MLFTPSLEKGLDSCDDEPVGVVYSASISGHLGLFKKNTY